LVGRTVQKITTFSEAYKERGSRKPEAAEAMFYVDSRNRAHCKKEKG